MQSELASLGFHSIALDLPAGEPEAGADRYAEVVAEAVSATDDDLVVVPHSLAGLYAPMVATRIGARGVVNLAALTPEPGSSGLKQSKALSGIYCAEYRIAPMTRHDDGSTSLPEDIAREMMYHDLDEPQIVEALQHLRRQYWTAWIEPYPLNEWPTELQYAHVACEGDRVLGAEGMHDGAARTNAPLTWIPGGHIPMLSHPQEAAAAVVAATRAW